jgi:hypothetical protein
MIAFSMVVLDVLRHRPPEMAIPDRGGQRFRAMMPENREESMPSVFTQTGRSLEALHSRSLVCHDGGWRVPPTQEFAPRRPAKALAF